MHNVIQDFFFSFFALTISAGVMLGIVVVLCRGSYALFKRQRAKQQRNARLRADKLLWFKPHAA